MPPKKKSNTFLYAVIALLFLGGVGFLVFQGLQENSTYFLDVAEAKSQDPSKLSNIRLFGTVAGEDIARPEKGTGVSFTLEDQFDKTNTLHVVYTGIVPDTFKEGAEVIIEGDLEKNGVFQSTKHKGNGIGIQSVRRIAEKANGACTFSYQNGVFSAKVMMRGSE